MIEMKAEQLARYIDHTLLSATATEEQIKQLCKEAKDFGFACVNINPRWVALAADELEGSEVGVGGVVSLPLGADLTKIKAAQAKEVIAAGANEVDMVADIAAIIERDEKYLSGQLRAVVRVCRSMKEGVVIKVIIESAALNEEQIKFACETADRCGADFVKTSTGMNPAGGARVEDVRLMKKYAGKCRVKAAGGIRTAREALEMIEAGAERIGTSSGVAIMNELKAGNLK